MTKVTIKCDWPECDYTLGQVDNDAANLSALVQLLQIHITTKHQKGESSSGQKFSSKCPSKSGNTYFPDGTDTRSPLN